MLETSALGAPDSELFKGLLFLPFEPQTVSGTVCGFKRQLLNKTDSV